MEEEKDSKVNVFGTLVNQTLIDAANIQVILELQVQILAKLENKDTKDIWKTVDERVEKINKALIESYKVKE